MNRNITVYNQSTWRRRLIKKLSHWQLLLLLLPAFAYVFIFNYVPMYGVQIAFRNFKPSKGIWGSPWVGLKYFEKFISLPIFWKLIRNTLSITLYSLLLFPLPVLYALMMNEVDSPTLKKTSQMISYAPHFISTVVLCAMVTLFLNEERGVINKLIAMFGGTPRAFMEDSGAFASIVVWSGQWQNLGWSSIIYFAALSGVSPELVEACKIDGANRLQIIRHVNLPAIMPTVVIMLILSCGSLLSLGFEKIYLLQNPLNLDSSQVIATYTYEIGLLNAQYSMSSAVGLFNNVINVIIIILVNAISRRVSETSLW